MIATRGDISSSSTIQSYTHILQQLTFHSSKEDDTTDSQPILHQYDSLYFHSVSHPGITKETHIDSQGETYNIDRYKLHISIAPADFEGIKDIINSLLLSATQKLVITAYKVANSACLATGLRMANFPFTLYLHDDFDSANLSDLIDLCLQLEKALAQLPSGNRGYLTVSDLPITQHIAFRQAALDKVEYIYAHDKRAPELKLAGENSAYYKGLLAALTENNESTLEAPTFHPEPTDAEETKPAAVRFRYF